MLDIKDTDEDERQRQAEVERLKRQEREIRDSIVNFTASGRLSRDDLHRRPECGAMREAYAKQPDSGLDVDDWSTAEKYEP